ncbi:MAG: hypothetical protein D6770_04690 [Anaerolineae bacterium]|nr:MAG: hypothetical protein D6770_04690 [Anaerolineae bacterium]
MLRGFVKLFGGDPHKREIEKLGALVEEINALEPQYEALSDDALRAKTDEFRARLREATEGVEDDEARFEIEQDVLDDILPHAFATVREAAKRTIGLRHYDVQLIGGITLHRGQIAEMKTGEGKTLVATLPLYLNALTGRGAHLVTVNDYLARRDARWMGPIFHMLGLSVGVLQMAASTEGGKKAYLYDPERESPYEDQHQLRMVPRAEAYRADITYGTNSEFGFDYLRDNMVMRLEDKVQRGHHYAIIDEVDNVLIDEARTPLIISGPASGDLEWYGRMAQIVKRLRPEDYEVNEKDRTVTLTEIGLAHVEELLGQPLFDPDRPEDITPEQARLMGYLEQALRAQFLFHRNKHYLVQGGKVIIVDEFTGRLMPGRRWSDGLHQAVEAKEGVRIEPENVTYATITLQNYFRMYRKLAGMTGTALTEAEEFDQIYGLQVLPIPTNLEYQAMGPNAPFEARQARDEEGYEYTYYVRRGAPPDAPPEYWKRKDYPDVIYRTLEAKLRAIMREIVRFHVRGRPLLVGTTSVENSERLSARLRAEPIRRLLQIMLLRHFWLQANNRVEDGRLIPELQPFNVPLEKVNPAELRRFARSVGASLSLQDEKNLSVLLDLLGLSAEDLPRLKKVIDGGVPHQVLNARKHAEESQIIAGAGAFGAVTIATNMAGRGVDIKLGGELAEEVLTAVNRVLRRLGVDDPYDMPLEERRQILLEADPSAYGIYESEIRYFLGYFEDMERVKALGGLHVIGSERHEARRIDNQLRGRAGRQGDPGSSRFFLSLEDDLMRLFGGEQVSNLMQRLQVDDSLPLENRLVSNIVEQSQRRVEGANFDVRKHLLEYDDVLNSQRERIYAQRDRVFVKEDLSEDIRDMLRLEVERRVPEALEDPEGPWRLLAWLEGVQPSLVYDERLFPSYTSRLLLEELAGSGKSFRESVLDLVRRAIDAEHAHVLRAIENLVERTAESLETQLEERLDTLDTFLESLRYEEETRSPQEVSAELSALLRFPLRLSNRQVRTLLESPDEMEDELRAAVESHLVSLGAARLVGAVEYRLGESLGLAKDALREMTWEELVEVVVERSRALLEARREGLVGENGQVVRDLDVLLKRHEEWNDTERIRLLNTLAQGRRTAFDSRTHRQVQQVFLRFNYVFAAAQHLEGRDAEAVINDVMTHLEQAQQALQWAWGWHEWHQRASGVSRLADLGPAGHVLGAERINVAPSDLSPSEREAVVAELGRLRMTEIQRQVLLSAITDQWVDYLTRVEALRVSIGLEAYAQRDPLVQYKSRASEMFQQLLSDIRAQVVSRIFAYQPRATATVQDVTPSEPVAAAQVTSGKAGKKRKRRKRRKRHK